MFVSGRKVILSNLLHQSLTLSYLLLILHNCIPDFHGHQWIPVYSISKGNGNLQVQYIPAQTAVTRQEHAITWSAGMNWKPHPHQECHLLLPVRKCCSSAGEGHAGDTWHQTVPPAPASAAWVAIMDTALPQRHRASPKAFICKAMATQHWYYLWCILLG